MFRLRYTLDFRRQFLLRILSPTLFLSRRRGRNRRLNRRRLTIPGIRTKTSPMGLFLAYTTIRWVRTDVSHMSDFIAVEADGVVTIVCKVAALITFSTGVLLAIVGEADEKFAETEIGRDSLIYPDTKVTITIEDKFIIRVSTTTITHNLAVRLQSFNKCIVRKLVRRIVDVSICKEAIGIIDRIPTLRNLNNILVNKGLLHVLAGEGN